MDAEITLTAQIELDEDGLYVAQCVELGTSSYGFTADEAMQNIAEAVLVHLDTLGRHGTLTETLSAAGVAVFPGTDVEPAQPEVRKVESRMRVPIPA